MKLFLRLFAAILFVTGLSISSPVIAQLNTYSFSQSVNTFQPITGSNIYVSPTAEYHVPLPFIFKVDTVAADSIWINVNGYAGLKKSGLLTGIPPTPLSLNRRYNGVMAPFAMTQQPAGVAPLGAIKYATTGTAPNRIFKVEWLNMGTASFRISYQLWLYEGSNRIDFVYSGISGIIANPNSEYAQVGLRSADTSLNTGGVVNRTTLHPAGGNTFQIYSWANTEPGTTNAATCQVSEYSTAQHPVAGLTFTWMPASPCSAAGSTGTLPDSSTVCYGNVLTLTPGGTPSGLTYQWQQSTDNVNWTALTTGPGSGQFFFAQTLPATVPRWYRRKNTCTQTAAVTYTNAFLLKSTDASPVPYNEGFEVVTANTYTLPGCLTTSLPNLVQVGPSIPNSGARAARFVGGGASGWLMTPGLLLESGKQYRISCYYRSGTPDSLRLGIGTFPDAANIATVAEDTFFFGDNQYQYRRAIMTFTVPATGRYFGGIRWRDGSLDNYVDDLQVIEVPQMDASVDSFIAPIRPTCFPTARPVTVRVVNAGQQALTNTPVYYRLNNTTYGPELIPTTIAPGASLNYTFTQQANLSGNFTTYALKAWSGLSGDGSSYNDSAFSISFRTDTLHTAPYLQNFESGLGTAFVKWYANGIPGVLAPSTTNNNPTYLHTFLIRSNPNQGKTDSIATVAVSNITANTFLQFDYRIIEHNPAAPVPLSPGDTIFVLARSGCNTSSDTLMKIHSGNAFNSATQMTIPPISLAAYAGTYVRISYKIKLVNNISSVLTYFELDNFRISNLPLRDIALSYLFPLPAVACTGTSIPVKVVLKNEGGFAATGFTVKADLGSTAGVVSYTYSNALQYGKSDTVIIGNINPSAAGPQAVRVYATLLNDLNHSNDTLSTSVYVASQVPTPVPASFSICNGASVQLPVSGNDSTLISYYPSATATTPISLYDTLTVNPSVTTVYYASNRYLRTSYAGKDTPSLSSTFPATTWGLTFSLTNPIVLDSMAVYPTGTGSLTVSVRSCAFCPGQTTLGTFTYSFAGATGTKIMVPVKVFIPTGEGYVLRVDSYTGSLGLRRDFPFSGYPIVKPGSPLIVTSATANSLPGYDAYYYFYRLVVRSAACETPRVPVTVNVSQPPLAAFTVAQNGATVLFTNTSTGTGNYTWDFGDGNTSTQMSPSHTYAANGLYSVKLVLSNTCGVDSVTQGIAVTGLRVGDPETGWKSVKLYPNPAGNTVRLSFVSQQAQHLHLSVYNMLGVKVAAQDIAIRAGANVIDQNLEGFSAGGYVMQLRDEKSSVSIPFIVAGK